MSTATYIAPAGAGAEPERSTETGSRKDMQGLSAAA